MNIIFKTKKEAAASNKIFATPFTISNKLYTNIYKKTLKQKKGYKINYTPFKQKQKVQI